MTDYMTEVGRENERLRNAKKIRDKMAQVKRERETEDRIRMMMHSDIAREIHLLEDQVDELQRRIWWLENE